MIEKTYVIAWQMKIGGRSGRGKTLFTFEEAQAKAAELNRDYPAFDHSVVPAEDGAGTPLPELEHAA